MFPRCGHFNQHMTICPKRWTPSIYTHVLWLQPKGNMSTCDGWGWGLEPEIFISSTRFLQGYLYLSHSLFGSGKSFSLWTFKSTELRVVVVMAHMYFEPQCTSLSPGQPFVNFVFIKPHFKSPNLRGYVFSVSILTSSLESNSFSCSPCRHILMVLILFILTELCLWSDLLYFSMS